MPLIEGFGDEVVQFIAAVFLITVSTLAWWSTNARPDRYRSVVMMRSRDQQPVAVTFQSGVDPRTFFGSRNSGMARTTVTSSTSGRMTVSLSPVDTLANDANSFVIPLQEIDSIIDADIATFSHNRMHFYRRVEGPPATSPPREESSDSEGEETEPDTPPAPAPASTEQIREMDDIVNAMRGDVSAPSFTQTAGENNSSPVQPEEPKTVSTELAAIDPAPVDPEEANRRKILIKLMYLNDTQKEVEGSLDELVKDFKRRHFSKELTEQSIVRLIYRGHVLEDTRTLRALGLQHRAVVHALVHPRRQRGARQAHAITEDTITAPLEIIRETRAPAERAWDLENILMTLVSVALTVVWFFRCEYSNMFTASASVALFGLTIFYSVAIFGLYISDTFQLDRHQDPPVPAI